jgi:hypothetical protein
VKEQIVFRVHNVRLVFMSYEFNLRHSQEIVASALAEPQLVLTDVIAKLIEKSVSEVVEML